MKLIVLLPQNMLKETLYAKVDDLDYDWLSKYHWSYGKVGTKKIKIYAYAHIDRKMTRMHNLIMGQPPKNGLTVDHKNGDSLDNRRDNLRWATMHQQMAGKLKSTGCTSKYKGIYWYESRQRWMVQLVNNGKRVFLGYFKDEKEAAKAYNRAAIKYHGNFARLNVIEE